MKLATEHGAHGTQERPREHLLPWMGIYAHALLGTPYLLTALEGRAAVGIAMFAAWAAGLLWAIRARHTKPRFVAVLPVVTFGLWTAIASSWPALVGL